jgi:tetratricopeptide (TPR) repeat protein
MLLFGTSRGVCAFKYVMVGMDAPQGKLLTLEGQQVEFSSRHGDQGTIVLFWALWSPRSREQLVDLVAAYDTLKTRGVEVVAVSVDGEDISGPELAEIRRLRDEHRIPFALLLDPGLKLFYDYGVIAVPSSAVVNPQSQLVYSLAGYSSYAADTMVETALVTLGLEISEDIPVPDIPLGSSQRFFNLGVRLLNKGDATSALSYLQQAQAEDSTFAPVHYFTGLASAGAGDLDRAERAFAGAVHLQPNNAIYLLAWAEHRLLSADTSAAVSLAEQSLAADSNFAGGRALLARISLARSDWSAAEVHLETGLAWDPNNLELGLLQAARFLGLGDTTLALSCYRQFLTPRIQGR